MKDLRYEEILETQEEAFGKYSQKFCSSFVALLTGRSVVFFATFLDALERDFLATNTFPPWILLFVDVAIVEVETPAIKPTGRFW
jgi:hypothetical protein